jgi:isohexenylglutaconyl-CoA hydratase
VRGITLRGRGGVFCAGADLKAFRSGHQGGASGSREAVIEQSKRGAAMFEMVNTMPQVVIAVVEGAAMAGGLGLACCADVVICDASAKFALTETAIGLSPAQISPFVIQKLGFATARRLMLTAARFDGREAGQLGLADFVGEGAEALETVEQQIKAQVLKCAPGAIADTKALILAQPGMSRAQIVQAAAENFAGRLLSDEAREGVASFVEKRKPRWAVDP